MSVANPSLPDFEGMPVKWIRSPRRTMAMQVHPDGWLEIRSPLHTPKKRVSDFIVSRSGWIRKKRQDALLRIPVSRDRPEAAAAAAFREKARIASMRFLGHPLLAGVQPARFSYRSQRSRWGSCSSRGTISLNYACARLPEHLLEYIIAHELCHLARMDHSAAFYRLLNTVLPDAAKRKSELSRYRIAEFSLLAASPVWNQGTSMEVDLA